MEPALKINWLSDYEEALRQSQAASKPILLFFTGSNWCQACIKLKSEALSTPEFIAATHDKYIFMIIDFLPRIKVHTNLTYQASKLQKKYEIVALPTVVITDSEGKKIGAHGYISGGGKIYAENLNKLINHQ
jgi:protein disulfide-isomerase